MRKIDELESRLQKLIERRLLKILPWHTPEDRLSFLLAEEMFSNLKIREDGSSQAPNLYVIVAHPVTLANYYSQPQRLDMLADALQETSAEAGLSFSNHPKLNTSSDLSMLPGEIRILATFSDEDLPETQGTPVESKPKTEPEPVPPNAFLVLHGTKIIPLNQAVVNIGRRLDNQVVIDDPRVSRNHAQLRVIKGRFVIFDLESTGGLFVNGQRANQSILYPGDVISLAGVTVVFGQDFPAGRKPDQDQTSSSFSSDRPTAYLDIKKDHKK